MKKLLQRSCNLSLTRVSKLFFTFFFLFLTCFLKAQTVTITTDQDDYYPGEWVIISGSGWTPHDSITLSIKHIGDNIPNHTHAPWTLVTDANGNLFDEWYVAEMELNTTLWLQAQSETRISMYAEKVFTDAWTLNLQSNRQSASSFCASTVNNIIHSFIINVSNPNGQTLNLTGIKLTIAGTWTDNDISNFKLYYTGTSNTFVNNELLTIISNPMPFPNIQTFIFNTPSTFTANGTYYFWITADLSANAVNGHTIKGNSITRNSVSSTCIFGNGEAITSSTKTIVALPMGNLIATENSGEENDDNIICMGDNISFTATAGFLNYDFKMNGSSVQSGPISTFNCSSLINDASVTVEVANSSGCSSTFGPAFIKVNKTPTLTHQPLEQHITYGMNANFTVVPSENEPFTYKWQVKTSSEDYTDIIDGIIYANSTSAILTLTKPTVAMTGNRYRCVVSNIYGSTISDEASLIVNLRPITITADAKSKTYGDTDPSLIAEVTTGSIVSGDAASGSLIRAEGENAGAYLISKATYTFGSNYDETFVGNNLVIGRRPITITADALGKTYGDADPALTAHVTSGTIVGSDVASGSLSRAAGENVGSYAISKATYTFGSNYDETFTGANLDINQRHIAIIPDSGLRKVYGHNDPEFTFTSSEVLISVNSFSGVLGRAAGENVADGPYTYNLGTLSAGSNYKLTLGGSSTFIISKAPSTTVVTITGAPFNYVGAAITPAIVNVAGAGNLSLIPLADYANNINAGTASASYTYPGDANHEGSSDSKTFNIGKAASETVVTVAEGPFTYTGSAITPASAYIKGAGGLNIILTPAYANNINAGVNTASASYTYPGDENHEGSTDSKNFTIGKVNAVISVIPYSVTYDGLPHKAKFTATGIESTPADLNDLMTVTSSEHTNAGNYTDDSWSFAGNNNYNASGGIIHDRIAKASSTTIVTINDAPFTYTGSAITPGSVSVTGAGGLSLTPAPSYLNNFNAGTATASFAYAGDANHESSSDNKTFDIGKAASYTLITVLGAPFTYTSSAITPASASVTGAGGLSLTPTPVYANNIDAGTASASYTYPGDDNHLGSSDGEDFTIGKAASATVVTVLGGPFTYTGFAITPASVSITGAGGLNLSPDPVYVNNINAGTASASYTFTGDDNHFGSSDGEDFTIGKAASVTAVTIDGGPFTYTGSAITPASVSITGARGFNLTPAPSYSNNINAGTASASYTFTGDDNHLGSSDSENFIIGKAVLEISAESYTRYIGQENPLFSGSISGVQNNEVIDVNYTTGATAESCTGTYTITPSASGNSIDNYKVNSTNGTLEVLGLQNIDASASSDPVKFGISAVLSATVNPVIAGIKVTFKVNEDTKGFGFTNSNGTAEITVSGLEIDVYKIEAVVGVCTTPIAAYLPVYDPNGGFVTGGGWIMSPSGAYVANSSLTGKANFGFNSKYRKGSNTVDGNTEFQFNTGNFNFSSDVNDAGTLVISGAKATYRGIGTVNGLGNYGFMVSTIDGAVGGGFDKFRIKIWDKDNGNQVIYDNQIASAENDAATTFLGGGSIVIHNDKTKSAEIVQIQLEEEQNIVLCTIVAPNGFSPNGDGLNEYFKVTCLQDYPDADLKIYTSEGRLVYEQEHYGNVDFWGGEDAAWWKGRLGSNGSGSPLPSGSYVYILELSPARKDLIRSGVVFISR